PDLLAFDRGEHDGRGVHDRTGIGEMAPERNGVGIGEELIERHALQAPEVLILIGDEAVGRAVYLHRVESDWVAGRRNIRGVVAKGKARVVRPAVVKPGLPPMVKSRGTSEAERPHDPARETTRRSSVA